MKAVPLIPFSKVDFQPRFANSRKIKSVHYIAMDKFYHYYDHALTRMDPRLIVQYR